MALQACGRIAVLTASSAAPMCSAKHSASFDTRFMKRLDTVDERMLILIDIERLMSARDMALVATVSAN